MGLAYQTSFNQVEIIQQVYKIYQRFIDLLVCFANRSLDGSPENSQCPKLDISRKTFSFFLFFIVFLMTMVSNCF